MLGISMGYHRLHTHRGFKTPKLFEYFLAVLRHADARRRTDLLGRHAPPAPSALRPARRPAHAAGRRASGRTWAGSSSARRITTTPRSCRATRPTSARTPSTVADDVSLGAATRARLRPARRRRLAAVNWAIFLRVVVGLHATWLVNSATHIWGRRRFATSDDSTNTWWVALLTFGEGWHNNHHAHPTSARHGLAWYEFDSPGSSSSVCRPLGLVWDVKVAKSAQVPRRNRRLSARVAQALRAARCRPQALTRSTRIVYACDA